MRDKTNDGTAMCRCWCHFDNDFWPGSNYVHPKHCSACDGTRFIPYYYICPKEEKSVAQGQIINMTALPTEKPMLVKWEPISAPDCDFIITGDQGRELARIKPNGDVELFGDVNEAALRFWTAVCQQSGGTLTKHSGKEGEIK